MNTSLPKPSGALALWQEELRRGVRGQDSARPSTWLRDDLWRAACHEAAGLEALRAGLLRMAEECFRTADEVLTSGYRKSARGQAA